MRYFKYLLIIEKTNIKLDININIYLINGGESGIRTHGTREGTHTFQACALNRSAISPKKKLAGQLIKIQMYSHKNDVNKN